MSFFIFTPQNPSQVYYDPQELFEDYRRREYVAALREEQAQRAQFERELALEEERHRRALSSLHQQEILRRRQSQLSSPRFTEPRPQRTFCRSKPEYVFVDPEEIHRRRQAREEEEQRRAREFHHNILSQIFGVPEEELAAPARTPSPATAAASKQQRQQQQQQKQKQPAQPTTNDKGKQRETAPEAATTSTQDSEPEPHWSAAPQRAAALAEISSINRAFTTLKNTFVFPSGPLERLAGSDLPRLAYNPTNATIHAYEHALSELLSKLDTVESYGFKGVREARKQLVVKIEKELEDLEKKIAERLAGAASPAVATTAIPEVVAPVPVPVSVEFSVPIEEVSAPVAESSVDTEMTDETSKAPATEGYDVEFNEPAPAPLVEPTVAVEAPVEQPAVVESSEAMEVEPAAPVPTETKEPELQHEEVAPVSATSDQASPTPVPTPSVFTEEVTKEPQDPHPVEQVDPTPVPVPASEPAAEVSTDEDSEIEDAVHVVIETDDEKEVDEKKEPARDQEGDFELV